MSAAQQYGEIADGLRWVIPPQRWTHAGECGQSYPESHVLVCDRPERHDGRHVSRHERGYFGWSR